jgi:serine/threonine protein phosphatase PrpC
MKIRPGVEIAGLTDVGCQRENNEDSYGYWESDDDAVFARLGRLAIVADGMGGHEGGQVASHIAVDTIQQSYSNASDGDPQRILIESLQEAHHRIQHLANQDPELQGMGTTCTACAIVGRRVYYAHVGDSRLYLLRSNTLRVLSRDHSLVARLIETGMIRQEDAESHPQKHVLTAALGVTDDVEPDVPTEPLSLEKSDVLLICTDGLWGQLTEAELKDVLSSQAPSNACESLVRLAKEHGGPDNVTLQIARIVN